MAAQCRELEEHVSIIIGIAGGTARGKSTLAQKLAEQLGEGVRVVHMDTHFRPEAERPHLASHVTGKQYMDDNSFDSINFDTFHAEVEEAIASTPVVILEGLFVLADPQLRDRIDLRVFVDCRSDERLVRRIKRNMGWGLGFDEITNVYLDMVRFRHDQNIEPSKWTADIILNGSGDPDVAAQRLVKLVGRPAS